MHLVDGSRHIVHNFLRETHINNITVWKMMITSTWTDTRISPRLTSIGAVYQIQPSFYYACWNTTLITLTMIERCITIRDDCGVKKPQKPHQHASTGHTRGIHSLISLCNSYTKMISTRRRRIIPVKLVQFIFLLAPHGVEWKHLR